MRQAIFVVVLVGAAFLGGAMVNGPGIRWVQSRLLDYMGLKDGGEIASIDLPPASSSNTEPHPLAGSPTVAEPSSRSAAGQTGPIAKSKEGRTLDTISLLKGTAQVEGSSPTRLSRESTTERNSSSTSPAPPAGGLQQAARIDQPHLGPHGSETPEPSPAPLDPSVGPALLASLSPSPQERPARIDRAKPEAIPLEVAPSSTPSRLSAAASSAPSSSMPKSSESGGESGADWVSLRRKLQSLGVTRYTIEGEPSGHVVFSCLIPLAGRQAVTQRFEAEGDNELQAAQGAIRRISLWRATRTSSSP